MVMGGKILIDNLVNFEFIENIASIQGGAIFIQEFP